MARISYASQSLADLERISDFLSGSGSNVLETLDLIDEAIAILSRHPLIGKQAESGLRELVISHGGTGYVALYSYEAEHFALLVLAIRHQRGSGIPWTDKMKKLSFRHPSFPESIRAVSALTASAPPVPSRQFRISEPSGGK